MSHLLIRAAHVPRTKWLVRAAMLATLQLGACESAQTGEAPDNAGGATLGGTVLGGPLLADAGVAVAADAGASVGKDSPAAVAIDAGASARGSAVAAGGGADAAAGGSAVAAGAGADAGVAAGGGAVALGSDAGTRAEVTDALKPKCVKKDSQLIVIGDSYVDWISHSFPEDIKRVSGQSWRMEAVGGTSMGSGGIGSIPQQFYDALARDPDAHTVLMDGGGNDILVPDFSSAFFFECTTKGASSKPNCQMIVDTALKAADALRERAAAAGIRDVVYFFYPHVPANTILSGDDPAEILDYALPKVREFCASMLTKTGGKTRCTFIDMMPVFDGHMDWFNEDIHPNAKGSAAMAQKIWQVMSERCIGQKGSKDCCES